MKAFELIALLQQYPPDIDVFAEGDGGNYIPAVSPDQEYDAKDGHRRDIVLLHPQVDDDKRDLKVVGTQVFIDGVQFAARGMSGSTSARGRWMQIDADGVPTSGEHLLRIVLPDETVQEFLCEATTQDEEGFELLQPRFYLVGKPE